MRADIASWQQDVYKRQERYGTIQDALAAYNYGEQGAKQDVYKTQIIRRAAGQSIINR